MATYSEVHQAGKRIDHTPSTAISAGTIVVVNVSSGVNRVKGVATSDIAANEAGSLDAEYGRIYKCTFTPGSNVADGQDVFVEPDGDLALTSNSGANPKFGQFVGAWTTTATTVLVRAMFALLVMLSIAGQAQAQRTICINGVCYPVVEPFQQASKSINLVPLNKEDVTELDKSQKQFASVGPTSDRFEQVVRATVRVTVSGVCGSGTIVGRDSAGRALILTNAHVAGTSKGRVVNVERWEANGQSERSTAAIISSGYGRGVSLDFALLRAADGFARDVVPIPLADRQPDASSMVTTFGCPRCEWPSLQVLKMNKAEGQILRWAPQAIGGRSGSGVVDYVDGIPRVVGLLTWGGGGEGLGQSTPFILAAMRGQLPKTIEALPAGVEEVAQRPGMLVRASWPEQPLGEDEQDDLIGTITDKPSQPVPPSQPKQPDAPIVAPSEPGSSNPSDPVTGPLNSPFRRSLIRAAEEAFKANEIKRLDLMRIRVASLSPKVLDRLELAIKEQAIAEGKHEVAIGPDGQVVANFDWSKLIPFIRELVPLVLQIIDLITSLTS